MHVNFGIFQPLEDTSLRKAARYQAYSRRGLADLKTYISRHPEFLITSNSYEAEQTELSAEADRQDATVEAGKRDQPAADGLPQPHPSVGRS